MNSVSTVDPLQRDDIKLRLSALLVEIAEATSHWTNVDGLIAHGVSHESPEEASSLLARLGLPEAGRRLWGEYCEAFKAATDLMMSAWAAGSSPQKRKQLEERYGRFPDPDVDEDIRESREQFTFGRCRQFNGTVRGILRSIREVGIPPAGSSGDEPITHTGIRERKLRWLAEAMLTVQEHPGWSDARIANCVDKHPSTLSRSREYQAAAAIARSEKGTKDDMPNGYLTQSDGFIDVEAVDRTNDPAQMN